MLGANVNASAASKASQGFDTLAKLEMNGGSSNISGPIFDFDRLGTIIPIDGQQKKGMHTQDLEPSVLVIPDLNSQQYKSKRGTRMVSKYMKFAKKREAVILTKTKKRIFLLKLSKLEKAISRSRPQSLTLQLIKEESF